MFRRRDVVGFGKILRLLRPYANTEWGSLAAGAVLGVAAVLLEVFQPWPLKWILDAWTEAASGRIGDWVARDVAVAIPVMAAIFVTASFAAAAAEYGHVIVLSGAGNRVLYRFRSSLFRQVLDQPLSYHESREVGELLTRVVYDTSRLRRGLNLVLTGIFKTLVLFASVTIVLLVVDPRLGLVMASGGMIALGTMRRRGNRIAAAARKQRKREGSLAALVASELMAVRELQAFGAGESRTARRFTGRNDRSLKQEQKVRRLAAGLSVRVDVLLAATTAVALWLGTQRVAQGALTAGDLVVFFSYAMALRTPFRRFARQTARIGRIRACGERLVKINNRPARIHDAPDAAAAPPFRGDITLTHASLRIPRRIRTSRKWAVRNVSVEIPAGTRCAVVGPNGAGKSTLLRLVMRLDDPHVGQVHIDRHDVRTLTMRSVRNQMSVVFQDSVLSGLSVRENIALGVPTATLEDVERAAAAARASTFIEGLPQGYDTLIRRGGRLFSGGERQRIAIARAFLRNGSLWLLDEPTAGLDPATADSLTDALVAVTRGRTALWVTHDPKLLHRLDWVIALDEGRMVYAGPSAGFDPSDARGPSSPLAGTGTQGGG